MSISGVLWDSKGFFLVVLFMQILYYVTTFFNIPIARQIFGFLYFTFIPGLILIKLLGLNERDWTEIVLLSVGFSITFLMVGGLLINEILLMLGFSQPLSSMPLIILFNSFILMSGFLASHKGRNIQLCQAGILKKPLYLLFFISLPILSITGAMVSDSYQNNTILLFIIIVISLLFVFVVFSKDLLSNLYSIAIWMMALALLYHSSFISSYIVPFGSDVPVEYFVFKNTESNACWSTAFPDQSFGRINAMLSVTVLPTIYSKLLSINSTWLFKIIFPFIFSLVPLGLYRIWCKHIGEKRAFISVFFFMAYETFYSEMLGLNRQMICELFLVLLLFIILDEKINQPKKLICFITFSFGLVTSHYGVSVVFMFLISFCLFTFFLMRKFGKNINHSKVILFFTLMFGWYIFMSRAVIFDSILEYGDYVYRQLSDFLNLGSREPEVLRGIGLEAPPSIWNTFSRVFAYITEFLIVAGFVGLITKRLRPNYEREYFIFTVEAVFLLIALIAVPGLANTMNMTRFYHILLFILAPLCVLGADFIVKMIMKSKHELATCILLAIVLTSYFLFQTELIYELTGSYSWSIPLSRYRMPPLQLYGKKGYMDSYSVNSAQWLSTYADFENSKLYADVVSRNYVLTIYGMIYRSYVYPLSNVTVITNCSVIYLSTLNVVENLIPFGGFTWNSSDFDFIFDELSLVYANGGSMIYERAP